MLGAVIGLVPMAVAQGDMAALIPSGNATWTLIAAMALTTTVIPQLIYSYAAPRIVPARSAIAGSFELPTMLIIGWLALGETIGIFEILAGSIIITAILFAPAPARRID